MAIFPTAVPIPTSVDVSQAFLGVEPVRPLQDAV